MKRFHLIITGALLTTTVLAQTETGGSVKTYGGLGAATPWGADFRLSLKGKNLSLSPFVSYSGIGKEDTAEDYNMDLTYTSSGNQYLLQQHTESKGYQLNFGAQMAWDINARNTLKATVTGLKRYTDTDLIGTDRLERVGHELTLGRFDGRQHNMKNRETHANVEYVHRTERKAEFWSIVYKFDRDDLDRESLTCWQGSQSLFSNYDLLTNSHTNRHALSFLWTRPINESQTLFTQVGWNQNDLQSEDTQAIDNNASISLFKHKQQIASAMAGYELRKGPLMARLQLEYDYTILSDNLQDNDDQHLNDLVPMARLAWNIKSGQNLSASYMRRIVRPTLAYLNPITVVGRYTRDRGTADLSGIHLNNVGIEYKNTQKNGTFTAAVNHIFVEDGFNAIWIEKDNIRTTFWGNQGARRAWSVAPQYVWQIGQGSRLTTGATLLWDKRIAEAIHMAKEHWGITANVNLLQHLPFGLVLDAHALYSEGNTIDLYSHASQSYKVGGRLERSFLPQKSLKLSLAYDHEKHSKIIITQGAYTGTIYARNPNRNSAALTVEYKF